MDDDVRHTLITERMIARMASRIMGASVECRLIRIDGSQEYYLELHLGLLTAEERFNYQMLRLSECDFTERVLRPMLVLFRAVCDETDAKVS